MWATSIVWFILFKYFKMIQAEKNNSNKNNFRMLLSIKHKTKVHTNHSNATNKYNERIMCKTCQTCWSQTGKCFTERIYWSIVRKTFSNAHLMPVHCLSDHFGWFKILPIPAEDCWRIHSSLKVKQSLNASSLSCCEATQPQDFPHRTKINK